MQTLSLTCPNCGAKQIEHSGHYKCPECRVWLYQVRQVTTADVAKYDALNEHYIANDQPYRHYTGNLHGKICQTDLMRTQERLFRRLCYLGVPPTMIQLYMRKHGITKGLEAVVLNYTSIMDELEVSYGCAPGVGASYAREDLPELMEDYYKPMMKFYNDPAQ